MGKKDGAPRGRMSSYAFFVQTCRAEHRKQYPGESVIFAEFTKKCAEKWRELTPAEKKRFEEMSEEDKARFNNEMAGYDPSSTVQASKHKRTKDPNAPKRPLTAFFFYSNECRPKLRINSPELSFSDLAKELGKKWENLSERFQFDEMARKDKIRYETEMTAYKNGTFSRAEAGVSKKAKVHPACVEQKESLSGDIGNEDDGCE